MSQNLTQTLELTRTVDGSAVPAAGRYEIDASHSHVGFAVRHLGIAKTRGRFAEFSGVIEVAESPLDSSVEVEIDAASIDTRNADRDGHLRSDDFFDVANHPSLSFRSTGVRAVGDDRYEVDGELTVRGITKPVTLDATFEGAESDPWGGGRVAFTASTEVDREDFGVVWNQALETGGVLVAKKVRIDLEVEAVRQP